MSLSPVMCVICVMCHVLSCRLASMTCLLLTHTRVNLCLTSLTSLPIEVCAPPPMRRTLPRELRYYAEAIATAIMLEAAGELM